MSPPDELGVRPEKSIREQVVDAARQRIRRVVIPAGVRRQPFLEGDQRFVARAVDLLFERVANVREREEIRAGEKLEDGRDQTARIHTLSDRAP